MNRACRDLDVVIPVGWRSEEVEDGAVVPDVVGPNGGPGQHVLLNERGVLCSLAEPLSHFGQGVVGDVEHREVGESMSEETVNEARCTCADIDHCR